MNKKRSYIGLASTFHDSAVVIVNGEGEVVFAEATERYLQYKKAIGIAPDLFYRIAELIKTWCDPGDEIVLAHTWSGEQRVFLNKEIEALREREKKVGESFDDDIPFFISRELADTRFQLRAFEDSLRQASGTLMYALAMDESRHGTRVITRRYDHHLTHAATACFTSPFREGLCAIIDGEGELGRANDVFRYQNGRIERLGDLARTRSGSLGYFFALVCQSCGFGTLTGEEWKVMGLAPYGKFDERIYRMLKPMVRAEGLDIKGPSHAQYTQLFWDLYSIQREKGASPLACADLAHTGQHLFAEVVLQHLRNLCATGFSHNLILGGGCALNSSVNGQILQNTGFENLHVFAAPADDGNALGAALLAFFEDHPDKKPEGVRQNPYLGSEMAPLAYDYLKRFGKIEKMREYPGSVHQRAAELLAESKIIGWVQGRAEFGPRALGNRSILADPRSPHIKDEINRCVKFREEFRPFAPSILHQFGETYFESYQASPYMERTLIFKPAVRNQVPAVVHANDTGRLQTVMREWNPRYYDLIHSFYKRTGVPMVLNTSFNIMGKPIIHTVEDAVAMFYTTGLDALIIGDLVIEK